MRPKIPEFHAYKVLDEEYQGGIVFAKSNMQARRFGASEYADGEWEYVTCRREAWADAYSPGKLAHLRNDKLMWEHGWNFECCSCGHRIDSDFADGKREPFQVEGALFCTPWCWLSWEEYLAGRALEQRLASAMAMETLPEGCVITRAGLSGSLSRHAQVRADDHWYASWTFPGARYTGQWKRFRLSGEETRTVMMSDLPAWRAFLGVVAEPELETA